MRTLLSLLLILSVIGLWSQGKPQATFETKNQIFHGVQEGDTLFCSYPFTNTGSADLQIYGVKATCGCTTPDWPREKIKPGDSAEIKVAFDSHHRVGMNAKGINLTSNAGDIHLILEVEVVARDTTR